LYVLMPYDYIFEFDIAYYERYRQKLPELNLPAAQYWTGADSQWSIQESMAANAGTPRTEFNTYLCNATWNASLEMTFEQATTNTETGPIVDNRYGNLATTVEEENAKTINMTEEGTDNLLLLSVYKDLMYDDTGTSYATGKIGLSGSYDCTSHQEEENDNADDVDDDDTNKKTKSVFSFTLTSLSSLGGNKTPASIYTVEGFASSCNGVATLIPKVPLPEVYSVSMGLQGHCASKKEEEGTTTSAVSSLFSTLLFDLKVNRTTNNDVENDDEDGVDDSSSSLLLLEGQWADNQGDQGSVTCARTNSNNSSSLLSDECRPDCEEEEEGSSKSKNSSVSSTAAAAAVTTSGGDSLPFFVPQWTLIMPVVVVGSMVSYFFV